MDTPFPFQKRPAQALGRYFLRLHRYSEPDISYHSTSIQRRTAVFNRTNRSPKRKQRVGNVGVILQRQLLGPGRGRHACRSQRLGHRLLGQMQPRAGRVGRRLAPLAERGADDTEHRFRAAGRDRRRGALCRDGGGADTKPAQESTCQSLSQPDGCQRPLHKEAKGCGTDVPHGLTYLPNVIFCFYSFCPVWPGRGKRGAA